MNPVEESCYEQLSFDFSIKDKKQLDLEYFAEVLLQNKKLKQLVLKFTQQKHDLEKEVSILRQQIKYMSKNSLTLAKKILSVRQQPKKLIDETIPIPQSQLENKKLSDDGLKYKKKYEKYKTKCQNKNKEIQILNNNCISLETKLKNMQIQNNLKKQKILKKSTKVSQSMILDGSNKQIFQLLEIIKEI